MRIATLNMQNLRLRQGRLFGARDRDEAGDPALDAEDRRLTAELLAATGADLLVLQEVFDAEALDAFHDRWLEPRAGPYPHRICLPGNDGRGLDVAAMARLPWDAAQSHAALAPEDLGLPVLQGEPAGAPLFRRDCLELRFGALCVFVCHFKAPYPDAERAWEVRRREAQAVTALASRAGPHWLVAGDLNEPESDGDRAIAPLEAAGENLMNRLPEAERWTYFEPHDGSYHCPDAFIASPSLAERLGTVRPRILRSGLGRESARYRGTHLSGVGRHRPHASDHAAVVLDLPED